MLAIGGAFYIICISSADLIRFDSVFGVVIFII